MFKGCCTALITPFTKDNKVNFKEFERIIEEQIAGGIDALLFLGTTGESPTLTEKEKLDIVKFAVKKVNKRVPVLVGAGSNCTAKAVENSIIYEALGVDGLLIVSPYYNKATQEGLYLHYKEIAESVDIPIIIYNVPSRTGVNVNAETVIKLSKIKNIKGLKQASSDFEELQKIVAGTDKDFFVYSGEDGLTYPMLCCGAKGVISVVSNLFPNYMSRLCESFFEGKREESFSLQQQINPLIKSLFNEVNPIPVKYAMNKLGYEAGVPRLPLTEMKNKQIVDENLERNFDKK